MVISGSWVEGLVGYRSATCAFSSGEPGGWGSKVLVRVGLQPRPRQQKACPSAFPPLPKRVAM